MGETIGSAFVQATISICKDIIGSAAAECQLSVESVNAGGATLVADGVQVRWHLAPNAYEPGYRFIWRVEANGYVTAGEASVDAAVADVAQAIHRAIAETRNV